MIVVSDNYFEDAFLRLSQTGFRLSAQVVGELRQSLASGRQPKGT